MFFLGFCPDKEANQKIRKVSSELGKVFDDLDISVRWSNPNSYHMVMVPLDTADVVVVPALSFTVGTMFERSPKAFKGIPAPLV